MSDNRTDLPSPSAPNFNQRLRETIQTYLGRQGNPLDRGLTLRDLIESGIVKLRDGFTLRPGQATVPIEPGPGVVDTYEPDLTPPPTPATLTATPAISHVIIQHEVPLYTQGHGHLRTRLYGKIVNAGDPLPTFAGAVEVAQFDGTVYAFPSNPATTWRFWIKWETVDGVLSTTPAGGTNGVAATTGQDVTSLLDALVGELTETQLYSTLQSRINLIDGPDTLTGSVNARVAGVRAQVNTINAELAQLTQTPAYEVAVTYDAGDLVTYNGGLYKALQTTTGNLPTNTTYWEKIGDYASLSDAVAAHAAQLQNHDTRISTTESGLTAEVSARQQLAAQVATNTAGIQSEATARANADSALSSTINSVSAVANAKNKTYYQTTAPASGMTAGDLWFDSDNNKAYRYSGSAWVATDDTRIAANAAAITSEATARANADSALSSQITTLTSTVNSNTAAIQTEATARANADSALSSTINSVSAVANAKNKTYYQTTAPASGMTAGDLWFDSDNNKAYRYSGSAWVATDDTRIAANAAAITSEATARANADSALSSTINSVSAVANAKNKTYYQTTAPASGMTAGDLWFDSDNNKAYRYSGSAWVATDDTRIAANAAAITSEATARANADSALSSQITTLTSTVNSNTAAIQTEATARANADSALAAQITTLQSTVDTNNTTLTAAVQTEASTRATETGNLFAKYTVKIDVAGHVSGYGLAATANNATPTSQFGVRANQFFVAPPAVSQAAAPTTGLYKGYVWVDTSVTPNVTKYYTGSSWSTTPQALPFVIQTSATTINGESVPAGVYIDDAYIKDGTITNAKIGNAAIDDAKIANLSASKITAGSIAVGQYIQSAGYAAGSSGWRINGDGNAELSNATVRGTVYATNGQFWGTLLGGAASSYSSGLGFYAGGGTTADGTNYRWRVGSPTGARIQWNGSAVEVYNSSNQLALSSGGITASQVSGLGALATQNSVSTSQVSGLGSLATQSSVNWNTQITNIPAFGNFAYLSSITSANISSYIAGAAIGTAYISDAAITQAKIGNLAVGSAQIADAAITTAKIGSAAVDTLQLAGQAVTIPVSAYTSGNITITGSTETTVQSVSLTSTGAPIFLLFTANIRNGNGLVEAGDSDYYNPVPTEIRIYRGATQIQRTSFSESGAMAVTIKDTVGAGNVTYYAKAYSIGGTQADGSSNAVVSARSLFLLETKR